MIEAPALMRNPDVRHGFFGRIGGHSTGIYTSLNCGLGSDDDTRTVLRNRGHVATALGVLPDQLVTAYQSHTADVAIINGVPDEPPPVDALVTDKCGLALGVLAADCTPILFADARAGVIGAAHAGWRGALAGVLEMTVQVMGEIGARRQDIHAVIGPTIRQGSYEVGVEFRDRFEAADASNGRFFIHSDRRGYFRFDLPAYVAHRLAHLRLASVTDTGLDTYGDEKRFFSYRRSTHRGEPDFGRQISAITLGPATFDAQK
ncbi:FIG00003370: Multicopper polyphenol oxidase [hydrothermal vent metagenome]|uniref:FIG00003370: Multicopper polyphenol oxidase n=1 Tax=hydrothermal vent metagenome TaxID=652676 RepID=A0A3B0T3T9_9ZZZZ